MKRSSWGFATGLAAQKERFFCGYLIAGLI